MARTYRLNTCYDIITPESAEDGDFAESGFICEGEKFTSFESLADHIISEGATEASSYPFTPGCWYVCNDYDTDYVTCAVENRSYHVTGLSDKQERELYRRVTGR